MGIFLHACNTPEKVIKTFAHAGISISPTSIHNGIRSLSNNISEEVWDLGQTLVASYAYDNFDIDFKTSIPSLDKPLESLVHLTSGLVFHLDHGVTPQDLKCSQELWARSRFNDDVAEELSPPERTVDDLLGLHPDTLFQSTNMTRSARYNAWWFRYDLVHNGPEYFRQFQDRLGAPEVVEQIPVTKLRHVPARAMDINQSKVSGNIQAITELLSQGGVGQPPSDDDEFESFTKDISEYVVLIHGDLGTYERVMAAVERRSLEATPVDRL
ncbi:hypothetical protein OF83DRAFT_1180361, partial [Amylostereum chailletii]